MISRARLRYISQGWVSPSLQDKCKDLFAGMLIVIAYLFVIKIVAGPPDQGQLMLLAMITESKRDYRARGN